MTVPRPETAAEEGRSWWSLTFLGICLQLGLALLVTQQFRLESRTFFNVALLMVAGFIVHAMLPMRWRQPFFAALSVASVFVAFGVKSGTRLVLIGSILIAICHLPVRFAVRVGLLLASGVVLAVFRTQERAFSSGVWAILGSMFMFRLVVYIDALRDREPGDPPMTLSRTVAYFFMAPNVSFPLFPVIDYNRFAKHYYDRPALELYQTGARWIGRGLIQLILYRLVYSRFSMDVATVRDLGDVLRYLLATYLLYLRVSGSFHLIVGMLYLFGYHLPETHHLYYLADSFNDYWRRINIYWKDFMMKLVYYPSFFRLRKVTSSPTTALAISTALVFVATWILHSYQWFWLRGGFPLALPDLLFWGILGTLVVMNALREAKGGRKRALSTTRARWSWSRAWKVGSTFTIICVLWSLWSAEEVMDWLVMWRAATFVQLGDLLALGLFLAVGLGIAGWQWDAPAVAAAVARPQPWYRRSSVVTVVSLLVVCALAQPGVQQLFGYDASRQLASLQRAKLNARDAAKAHIGYYEKMDAKIRQSTQPWDDVVRRPPDFTGTRPYRPREDFLGAENIPSINVISGYQPVSINRWGARGGEISEQKPAGTQRVAVVGPSYIFGSAVPDSGTFPAMLEKRLNQEQSVSGLSRFEVVNFGVSGTSLSQALMLLDARVFRFSPDFVMVGIDSFIPSFVTKHLTDVVDKGIPIPYPGLVALLRDRGVDVGATRGVPLPFPMLRGVARAVGVTARMPRAEIHQRIMMAEDTLSAWILGEIVRTSRAHGAVPLGAVIDLVNDNPVEWTAKNQRLLASAKAAGFTLADVRDTWVGGDMKILQVTPWDDHPSVEGYRLLAHRVVEQLKAKDVFATRPQTR